MNRLPRLLRLHAAAFLAGAVLSATLASAAPPPPAAIEHDLQQGLAYLRTGDIAADLPAIEKSLATHPALVLDLRQTSADSESAATLARLLATPPATPRFARFLLLSEATDPHLLTSLATPFPGVITLAARSDSLKTDITVGTTAERDRLAYQALADGLPFDKLLSCFAPQKIRYDEASLVRNHASGGRTPIVPTDDESANASAETTEAATNTKKFASHPVDRVLLRAVQLHRTLLALKKL